MSELEMLLETVREKQKKQIQEYNDQEYCVGTPMQLKWEEQNPVRFYINLPKERPVGRMKVFINAHGGGFIEGDAKQMGTYCQKLADRLGIFVVNVNYRLSPDFVFPYQCKEIEAIWDYLKAHSDEYNIDMTHCGIGGFSAGATLSLNCIVRSIEENTKRFSCCVLGYPMTSADPAENDQNSPYPACDEVMFKVINYYFNNMDSEPCCSALNADDEILKKFPNVIEVTCGKDSLRNQGRKLASKIAAVGKTIYYREFANARHGFIEVNRPDYKPVDPRKTPEQAALCKEAEEFIIESLASLL